MENEMDNMLVHMSKSQQAMASILGANQMMSRSVAGLIDQAPAGKFENREAIAPNVLDVTRSAASYVKALA